LKVLKRRYLAVSIECDGTLDARDFMDAVWSAVSRLFGEYGASQAGLSLIDYDGAEKIAIVRTSHVMLEMVRTALASISRVEKKPVAMHVLAVSGTIKTLQDRLYDRSVF